MNNFLKKLQSLTQSAQRIFFYSYAPQTLILLMSNILFCLNGLKSLLQWWIKFCFPGQTELFRCNFESANVCDFTQEAAPDDTFDWSVIQGPTESKFTGPDVDHSRGTDQGYYAYIETSDPRVGIWGYMYVRSEHDDIIAINAGDYSNLYYGLYWFETMEQAGYTFIYYVDCSVYWTQKCCRGDLRQMLWAKHWNTKISNGESCVNNYISYTFTCR